MHQFPCLFFYFTPVFLNTSYQKMQHTFALYIYNLRLQRIIYYRIRVLERECLKSCSCVLVSSSQCWIRKRGEGFCQAVLSFKLVTHSQVFDSGKMISTFLNGKTGMIMYPPQRIIIRTHQ